MDGTISLVRKTGFYKDIVLKALSRMDKGRLDLILPDGERIVIGDGKDGISAAMVIRHPEFYRRCVLYGDIGFGEAYVDGLWDTDSINHVISWVILNIDRAPGI